MEIYTIQQVDINSNDYKHKHEDKEMWIKKDNKLIKFDNKELFELYNVLKD